MVCVCVMHFALILDHRRCERKSLIECRFDGFFLAFLQETPKGTVLYYTCSVKRKPIVFRGIPVGTINMMPIGIHGARLPFNFGAELCCY
jgi:hypothetical protein